MPTQEKAEAIDELAEQLSRAKLAILTDYRGLNVTGLQGLRATLRPLNAEFQIAKNTLTRIAAEKAGIEGLDAHARWSAGARARVRRRRGAVEGDLGFRAHVANSDDQGWRSRELDRHRLAESRLLRPCRRARSFWASCSE